MSLFYKGESSSMLMISQQEGRSTKVPILALAQNKPNTVTQFCCEPLSTLKALHAKLVHQLLCALQNGDIQIIFQSWLTRDFQIFLLLVITMLIAVTSELQFTSKEVRVSCGSLIFESHCHFTCMCVKKYINSRLPGQNRKQVK